MGAMDRIRASARKVVAFESQGVAFRVRAVSSVLLAEHGVAALVAAKGAKTDPEGDRHQAEAIHAEAALAQVRAEGVAALNAWLEAAGPDVDKKTSEAQFLESEQGQALLEQIAAHKRVIRQAQAYAASKRRPEVVRKDAERNLAMVCAGIEAIAELPEEWDGDPEALAWEPSPFAMDPGEGQATMEEITWAVPVLLIQVQLLSKGDAEAKIAPFRG